ncbi:sporulation initiation factor Spo0A C-terminal domain-containing protein [Anaerotignum sp.]|uniref:sporulation initiation factor Spo0A C-terminal domain-containing protein n=1 Tax=Anaerotignum sp. TaxID=2039241 RepID=UPI0027147E23|nr:sporulation initiation factor Spo0A C-terminal domain-containing protein [Anaerotignum sp.]
MVSIIDIYKYFRDFDIKRSNNGFKFLMSAVQLGVEDVDSYSRLSDLYKDVAKLHSTEACNVERAIRYAVSEQNMPVKEFIMKAIYDLLIMDKERSWDKLIEKNYIIEENEEKNIESKAESGNEKNENLIRLTHVWSEIR